MGISAQTAKVARDVEPQLIAKYQRRFPGFGGKIISMYARGMTVREIQGHLEDMYGVDISSTLISRIMDAVNSLRRGEGCSDIS